MAEASVVPEGEPAGPRGTDAVTQAKGTAWAMALGGLVLATAWVSQGPGLIERLPVSGDLGAVAVFYALLFGPLVALALLFAKLTRVQALRGGGQTGRWAAGGLAIGAGGVACAALFAWFNGGLGDGTGGSPAAGMLAAGLALIAFQVGAEELLFRGWLQALLTRLAGDWPALLLGALAFAGMHLATGPMAPLSFVNLCLAGMLFALLAWRSGGIIAPFAAHLGWNAFEDIGLGLSPNPGLGPFGALHNFDIAGPALWGGGDEGLNASVGTATVLLALIVPLALGRPKAV